MDENQRFDIPWHKAFLLIPVVYKVLPMCLELSVTYVSGSYPPIKGEGTLIRHCEERSDVAIS